MGDEKARWAATTDSTTGDTKLQYLAEERTIASDDSRHIQNLRWAITAGSLVVYMVLLRYVVMDGSNTPPPWTYAAHIAAIVTALSLVGLTVYFEASIAFVSARQQIIAVQVNRLTGCWLLMPPGMVANRFSDQTEAYVAAGWGVVFQGILATILVSLPTAVLMLALNAKPAWLAIAVSLCFGAVISTMAHISYRAILERAEAAMRREIDCCIEQQVNPKAPAKNCGAGTQAPAV